MFYRARPQPCNSGQGFRGTTEDPSGGYEYPSSPQIPHTQHTLGHLPIEFPGCPLGEFDSHQNSVPDNYQKDFEEAVLDIQQQYESTYPKVEWSWDETEAQQSRELHEQQIWEPIGATFPTRGAGDAISYTDGGDTASSGQSTPCVIGRFYPDVAVGLPQPPHGVPYGSANLDAYRSTSGSLSGGNRRKDQDSRQHMQDSSSNNPGDTPPTQLQLGIDFNSNQDYHITHSSHHPPHKRRRSQQRSRLNTKPAQRKDPPAKCVECGELFGRPGDLARHLKTARVHSPPKGPLCPVEGCRYSKERFTRWDNLRPHLEKIHKFSEDKAAGYVQWWKDEGKP
ncbi:hypothetical protein HOY82DRAFT_620294 [Tuber indicum]|nr:hypothetical protein HOY82DRAFT_620294 [Tuber indicum]